MTRDGMLTVESAAAYADVHPKTLLRALQSKELVGYQRAANARWRIYQSDLDAWLGGPGEQVPEPPREPAVRRPDLTLVNAAQEAPRALGDFIGDAVAVVLMDHSEDEYPDPNIHELAHCVLMLARLGQGVTKGTQT